MDAMQQDADFSQVQLLKVDGGASTNNLLMQMQADALQVSAGFASHALQSSDKQVWMLELHWHQALRDVLSQWLFSHLARLQARESAIANH